MRSRGKQRIGGGRTVLTALLLAWTGAPGCAQSDTYSLPVEKHARELAITTGYAAALPGGTRGGGFWAMQLRLGRTLLAPRALHGALEAALELEPALVLHRDGFTYGVGFTPMLLQWNIATRGRVTPFINAGAGILFTSEKFPPTGSHFNFTPQGGLGAYIFSTSTRAWVLGVRYHHVSSSGLSRVNPGHNSLYIHGGISWWR